MVYSIQIGYYRAGVVSSALQLADSENTSLQVSVCRFQHGSSLTRLKKVG